MLECQALCKIIVSGIVALLSIQDLKQNSVYRENAFCQCSWSQKL